MRINNGIKTNITKILIIIGIVTMISVVELSAQESKKNGLLKSELEGWPDRPYCGLYCFYAYMRMVGKPVYFYDLVIPDYVTPYKGTTLEKLSAAAEDFGVYGNVLSRLTVDDLRQSPYPMVLHVKDSLEAGDYDHYVLFIEDDNGQAKLIDPPYEVKVVPYRNIVPLWEGNALILSTEPIHEDFLIKSRQSKLFVWGAIVLITVLMIRFGSRRLKRYEMHIPGGAAILHIGQAAGIGLLALLCGTGYNIINDAGFIAYPQAVSALQSAHIRTFIPKLSLHKTRKLLKNGSVFIDARMPQDYQLGHLEGAISVPVSSSDEERRKATAYIDKDARVVLYCQSAGCKFAEIVALKLIEDGYTDISIYKGGWAEWAAKNGKIKQEQS